MVSVAAAPNASSSVCATPLNADISILLNKLIDENVLVELALILGRVFYHCLPLYIQYATWQHTPPPECIHINNIGWCCGLPGCSTWMNPQHMNNYSLIH